MVRLGRTGPVFNLPKTARAASTCLSWFTRFVLSARSSDTIDTSPFRFAIVPPSGLMLAGFGNAVPALGSDPSPSQ